MRSRCSAEPTRRHVSTGPAGRSSPPSSGGCRRSCFAVAWSPRAQSCAGIATSCAGGGPTPTTSSPSWCSGWQGEPELGLPQDPGRTAQTRPPRRRLDDPPDPVPPPDPREGAGWTDSASTAPIRHRRAGRGISLRLPELPADSTPAEATKGTDFAGADASGPGPSSVGAGFGAAAAPAGGVLYGYNLGSRSLVFWDRFACDNYNSVILGRSGRASPTWSNSSCCARCTAASRPTSSTPKTNTPASPTPSAAPWSPPAHPACTSTRSTCRSPCATGDASCARDALTRRALFLHTFLTVLLGEPLTAIDRAVLDTAITDTYTAAGITDDPATWGRPAPLLADLRATLAATADRAAGHAADHRAARAGSTHTKGGGWGGIHLFIGGLLMAAGFTRRDVRCPLPGSSRPFGRRPSMAARRLVPVVTGRSSMSWFAMTEHGAPPRADPGSPSRLAVHRRVARPCG